MFPRLVRTACVTGLLCAIRVHPVAAQCGAGHLRVQAFIAQDSVAVVFVGTVSDVQRVGPVEIVTFAAERVWKGPVTQRMTIYKPIPVPSTRPSPSRDGGGSHPGESNPIYFQRGERYIVIAHRLNDAERRQLGVAEQDVLGTDVCRDSSRPVLEAGLDVADIGYGHAPTCVPGATVEPKFPVLIVGECGKTSPPIKIADAAPVYRIYGRVQGVVILEITIDETGRVSHAEILRSNSLYDRAAIDCVMKWKYLPALISDLPAPTVLTVSVRFSPP